MKISLIIESKDLAHPVKALLDSGANKIFISKHLIRQLGLRLTKLPSPIPVYNVDGTPNRLEEITSMIVVKLRIGDNYAVNQLLVMELG